MATPVKNFAKGTVSTTYGAADTSIVLTAGHGSRFPSTFPYPATWWNFTDYPDPADDPNREIVTVTNRVGDTLTVTRGAESTGASTKNTGGKTYKMLGGITEAMWNSLFNLSLAQEFRGLTLQTHPDSDEAAAKVYLNHADAVVMNDGEEIASWDDLTASLAVSGIGGLDTGTEQASTWYEIYGAYNGSAKGIFLHRAKNYNLDEESSAGEDATQGLRLAASSERIGQGFKTTLAGPVEMIDVKLIKAGTPTGNFWFTIEGNNGGLPNNTPLATSDYYDAARLTTAATWVKIPFRAPYSVSAATQYHLVMRTDVAVSGVNYIGWRMDGSAGAYGNGSKALYDSGTTNWTADADDDMLFKVYVTENNVDVSGTYPTGYSQYAKIGYCYNDGSSNLKQFRQVDRTVFCGYDDAWQIGALTSTTPDLISLAAFLPPVPVVCSLAYYVGSDQNIAVGPLTSTDLTGTNTDERIGMIRERTLQSVGVFAPLVCSEYQGIMFLVNAGTCNLYLNSFTW